jgi:hypothetical protein
LSSIDIDRDDVAAALLAQHLNHQHADHSRPDDDDRVIGPGHVPADGMNRDRDRFNQRGALERQRIGQLVQDARGHGHVLGECAVPPVISARDAEHHPVVAQVDVSFAAEFALAARHGRVERHAVADLEPLDSATGTLDDAGRFVSHHERRNAPACRSVISMDVASANPACAHAHEHVFIADVGDRHVDDVQFLVLGQ